MEFDQAATVRRLRASIDVVLEAAREVPGAYTHALMPGLPAEAWTVAMNIAHLIVYEEGIAIPILQSLAMGADGTTLVRSDNEGWFYNDAVAIAGDALEDLIDRLDAARARQIELVEAFGAADWERPVSPVFAAGPGGGLRSAAWIATKSFQHTWEHGNAVLRAMLFSPRG